MGLSGKISVICIVLGLTLLYSFYHQSWQKKFFVQGDSLILKKLPTFSLTDIFHGRGIDSKTFFGQAKLGMVHFWATWCAPCEAELPAFIALAKKFEQKGIAFLLVAVNDEDKKIKKFFKRFKQLPGNVRVAHDHNGKMSARFGTVKLPETYLFSSGGKHIDKYVGAQDWEYAGVYDRLSFYLGQ